MEVVSWDKVGSEVGSSICGGFVSSTSGTILESMLYCLEGETACAFNNPFRARSAAFLTTSSSCFGVLRVLFLLGGWRAGILILIGVTGLVSTIRALVASNEYSFVGVCACMSNKPSMARCAVAISVAWISVFNLDDQFASMMRAGVEAGNVTIRLGVRGVRKASLGFSVAGAVLGLSPGIEERRDADERKIRTERVGVAVVGSSARSNGSACVPDPEGERVQTAGESRNVLVPSSVVVVEAANFDGEKVGAAF